MENLNISELKKFEKLDEFKLSKSYVMMMYLMDSIIDDYYKEMYKEIMKTDLDSSESNKKYAWFLYVLNDEFRNQFLIDLKESGESGVDFINGEILRYEKLRCNRWDGKKIFEGRFFFKFYETTKTSRYLVFLDVMKFFYDKYGEFSYKYTGI